MIEILKTILLLIHTPKVAWTQFKQRNEEATAIQLNFYYPLLACVTLAAFGGAWFRSDEFAFANCLKTSVLTLSAYLAGYFLTILTLIEVFSRCWYVKRDYDVFVRLVTYSSSLMLIIKLIFSLFSSFFFLLLVNVYALFIVWEGLAVLIPEFEGELKQYKRWATFVVVATIYIYPNLFDGLLNYLMK
ncbi:MAG: hypothetical protein MJZ28_10895 [Paludibacteraceae bacterium]|nr:hypothetical protein [Paludibacteraceae bacterium]